MVDRPRSRPNLHRRELLGRGLVAVAAAAVAGGCGHRRPPSSRPSALYGAAMPSFLRPTIDGRELASSALRGRVVVVEFFASYCAPCRRSLPELRRLAARDRDLAVLAIGEDERPEATAAMAATYRLAPPEVDVLHDHGNLLAGRFRIDGLPSTFVIDGAGIVRWVGDVAHDARTLARVVAVVRRT